MIFKLCYFKKKILGLFYDDNIDCFISKYALT